MSQFSGALRTFKGGIHPPDSKKITEGKPIEDYLDPQMDLVYPMQQHIGAPCKPVVKREIGYSEASALAKRWALSHPRSIPAYRVW